METVIIGCKTLENELNCAIEQCSCAYDIKWVESGLHNLPKKLRAALQTAIDEAQGYSCALLAFGYCGNSVSGLRSGETTLIIPRADDCISLLLGSNSARAAFPEGKSTYFMTEGWLVGERNLWVEYRHTIDKYGEKTGKEIFDMMLEHYKYLALLDTGCFDVSGASAQMRQIADTLALEYKEIPATIGYLKRLLTGPWDEESFLIIPPHSIITEEDLFLV